LRKGIRDQVSHDVVSVKYNGDLSEAVQPGDKKIETFD
jgi:hypothetical protein